MSVVGTPDSDQTSFLTDSNAVNYINTFKKQKPIDFESKYPGVGREGIDFLERLLEFNPYLRMTADEAL